MDATPSVHLLRALGNQNLSWVKALAELVDNAFDANATRVSISMAGKRLVIEDDGAGMKDIRNALRLGNHLPSETTSLGMYGVGLKDAWLFAGDQILIESVRDGRRSRLTASVADMIRRNSWEIHDPEVSEVTKDVQSGTTIRLYLSGNRRQPKQESMETLAWTFTPALITGRQITHRNGKGKPKTLAPIMLPKFIDHVTETFDIDGKRVTIDIGIVKDGESMIRGPFWIRYRHRNLAQSSIGIGPGFSGARMGGVIELGDGFAITKNKDDFSLNKDELSFAINQRIRHLLEQADKLSFDVESKALTSQLESQINDAFGRLKREKRDRKNRQSHDVGMDLPINIPVITERKRRNAAKTSDEPGSVEGKDSPRRTGISVDFYADDDFRIGRFDATGNRIQLNENHAYVLSAKAREEVGSLYSIAIAILANYICSHTDAKQLALFEVEDFGQTFGSILKPMAANLESKHVKGR